MSDTARDAVQWIGVDADEKEKVIRELLTLVDALRPLPPRETSLVDKFSVLHQKLDEGEIPHAIGGALAASYYGVPRQTLDIDVNVFLPADRWPTIRDALRGLDLGPEIEIDRREIEKAEDLRIGWEPSALHLFFSCDPLHYRMRSRLRHVPFNGDTIPIVAPEHLVVRKALLDRTKDWIDVEQILVVTDSLDFAEVEDWLERMAGSDNPRMKKLAEVKAELSLD